ncbi:MAG TPA: glycosyltransferase family 39 protein [Candidatus Acidoferrales bacterium]|nr:glycosyltransferase family 39 protein [Candidatus Acidoferrales bacterium]
MVSITPHTKMRVNVSLAVLAGLALRVFFVLKFPVTESGDAPFYIELAWNWLKKGVYGFTVNGQLTPVDMRVPGYPAFLAAVFAFAGNSPRAVMLAQAVLDMVTCFLIALIAARLAPEAARRRVALAGLWLAALCPFTANYTAVVLTETLTLFLTTLAILILLGTELGKKIDAASGVAFTKALLNPWFLAGIVVGFGTLVRPETPLLLLAAGFVLAKKWWRPENWTKLLRAGLLLAVGMILPLVPWAARNWRTLHDVQFLAPRYSELPGEYTPLGFSDWTNTWLWHFRDVYLTQWKINSEEISMDNIPASAFDSPEERGRVSDLLDQYNDELTVGPELDQHFREIAHERTERHPLRTYLEIPFLRSLTLWFTPRIELLPYSGHLRPVRLEWEDDRHDFLTTLSLVAANIVYLGLGLTGAWITRRQPGAALLIAFIILRTAFFTTFVETPEPRYVLECFPAVIALGAQVFGGRR